MTIPEIPFDLAGASRLANPRTPVAADRNAATEFESYFFSMIIKEMRKTLDDGLFPGDQSDSYGGLFDMQMGEFLARQHRLGIANLIENQHESNHEPSNQPTS